MGLSLPKTADSIKVSKFQHSFCITGTPRLFLSGPLVPLSFLLVLQRTLYFIMRISTRSFCCSSL